MAEQDARGFAEYGVRTGRRRRKADAVDWELVREAVHLNAPTSLALSFCDHLKPSMANSGVPGPRVRQLIAQWEEAAGVRVSLLEFGKSEGPIAELL